MSQADLNQLLVFAKVVEHGSFIAASRALGLPKTTVSRKVQELEERLGARLLQRTTRRVALTEAGAIYHEYCSRIVQDIADAEPLRLHQIDLFDAACDRDAGTDAANEPRQRLRIAHGYRGDAVPAPRFRIS